MPEKFCPMFGIFDLYTVEESNGKNFFKNQPKRTLPRPVISERRKNLKTVEFHPSEIPNK